MATQQVCCFKAYDIRGKYPEEINEDLAYDIGRAYASFLSPAKVVVGWDVRPSSRPLAEALSRGLNDSGVDVLDIGMCGTEQIYFATAHLSVDGGIMVTASHNPSEYNGMKFVCEQAKPISGDTGLREIECITARRSFAPKVGGGRTTRIDVMEDYIRHLLGWVDGGKLRPFLVACNPGNGCAGPVIDQLEEHLPLRFTKTQYEPDGTFPHGVPNPLLPKNREATSRLVQESKADLGLAWDGDFDRCFFFDEKGNFIEGYYLVGFLSQAVLEHEPGAKIIHDPRLVWNTVDIVRSHGGQPVQSKTGHAFIKEKMRAEDAAYGGEMSAHHYFRKFSYCDSGMIPWLLVIERLSQEDRPLSALIRERMELYPVSGEINRRVDDPDVVLEEVERRYRDQAKSVDYTDGLSMEFARWRFNLRKSNTEPLLRLNVETRADKELLREKTEEVLDLIGGEEPEE